MGNMVTSAWFATAREVCWWLNLRASARIALERAHRYRVNIKTGVKSAAVQVGHMSLKAVQLPDEYPATSG